MANANMSKDELLSYIDDLEAENSDLQDTLDSIADLVAGPPADGDEDGNDQDDGYSDGDSD
jgi:hypothetical protein